MPINNVVIVSGGQQRDSTIHIHVSILPKLPSHPHCHITLSRVTYDVQEDHQWFYEITLGKVYQREAAV